MKEEQDAQISHILMPLHEKISEKDKKELLKRYNITVRELPKISPKDPAIVSMDVKLGDVIRIIRNSPTAGKTYFYRGVSNE